MNEKSRQFLIKYAPPTVAGIVVSIAIAYWRDGFGGLGAAKTCMAFSDGFFIASVLYIGFGLLLWVSSTGVLDIMGYGFKSLLWLFTPIQKSRDEGGFYEYKVRQREKRKGVPFHILWIGLALLAISLIFFGLYYAFV